MQQSAPSRKRDAPGPSPMVQQPMTPQPAYQFQPYPDNSDFNFDFSNTFPTDPSYSDANFPDPNNLAASLNPSQTPTYGGSLAPPPSTDLIRRTKNQQLAPQNGQQDQWSGSGGNAAGMGDEDERELQMKIELAKRDPQGKRKQIPPFVQKLSSFLDSGNTELIRWSDDGRSFIVLDEDEFARTLIPELFKHNNYASFVRQLNMYGFHKTVNITDGSLRQSEKARKGVKPPSMYSHPYFRKNRPDLLWLIQKPTGKSNAKRKRDGTIKDGFDSDEERQFSPVPDSRPHGELGAAAGQDLAAMPRTELAAVRQEIKKLQQQQQLISHMIQQLKEQNDQFYRQATAFQQLHDRHETSINAILTFLATFYNRSLDGHAGQNLVNMFSNMNQNSNQQQHGSVVEEYDNPPESGNRVQRFPKKPQLLLTGSEAAAADPFGRLDRAVTEPSSARHSASPPNAGTPSQRDSTSSAPPQRRSSVAVGRSGDSPPVNNDTPTPDLLHQTPENEQMLSFINQANATSAAESNGSAPAMDFTDAFSQFNQANGTQAPLTSQQRDEVLNSLMVNHPNLSSPDNNALTTQARPFSLEQFQNNQESMNRLGSMQTDLESNIAQLVDRVGSYSPSGSIPGLRTDDAGALNDVMGDPGQYDFEEFVNDPTADGWSQYAPGQGYENTGDDLFSLDNLNTDTTHLAPALGTVERLSSEGTGPATTAQVADEADAGELQEPGTPSKRQRKS
ncbi:heat shock factor 1-like [Lecanosticta acicola]|uniref:Heat shock factor 1-like n=1 Tax=Lecanosticta acicola TaxID=111012 RepID=A0AAI9EC96_9PEZI|nr:heat shock factor 1-like [Lecanosticta acicola]